MKLSANQNLILIEGAATYERILADVREVEIDEGLRHIKDFLKIYPDFAPAHNDLAVMYYQSGNALKALAHYEKALKLDPANITYRKNLADFYFVELEWTGEAVHAYLDILKDNPFDIEALNALGTISMQIGRKEQARQYFSRTLQLDATNHEAQQALQLLPPPAANPGASKLMAHSAPQAARGLERPEPEPAPTPASTPSASSFQSLFKTVTPPSPASASSPASVPTPASADELYKNAISLVNANRPNEAIQVLKTLVTGDPNNAMAHNDLGVLYQKCGDPRNSRFHHEAAVRLQPTHTMFQKNLADLLCSEFGELEEALRIYTAIQARLPQDIEVLKAIAFICQLTGNQADYRFFLERVLALQPWDRDAQEALKSMGETDTARELR